MEAIFLNVKPFLSIEVTFWNLRHSVCMRLILLITCLWTIDANCQDTILFSELHTLKNEGRDESTLYMLRGDDGRLLEKGNIAEYRAFVMHFSYSSNDDTCTVRQFNDKDSLISTSRIWSEGECIVRISDNNTYGLTPYSSKEVWNEKRWLVSSEYIRINDFFKSTSQHYIDSFFRDNQGNEFLMKRYNLMPKGTAFPTFSMPISNSDGNGVFKQPEIPDSGDVVQTRTSFWDGTVLMGSDESYFDRDYTKQIRYQHDSLGRMIQSSEGFTNDTNSLITNYSYREKGGYLIRREKHSHNLGYHEAKIVHRNGKDLVVESSSFYPDGTIMCTNFNSYNEFGFRTDYRYESYSDDQPVNSHLEGTVQIEEKVYYRSFSKQQFASLSPIVRFVMNRY